VALCEELALSDQDELPQWSAAAGQSAAHYVQPPERNRGRGVLFGVVGVAALFAMAALGYFLAQSQSDSTEASTDPAAPTVEDDVTASDDDESTGTDVEGGGDGEPTGTDTSTEGEDDTITVDVNESGESESEGDESQADGVAPVQSERTAVLKAGTLYLRGKVPSQEIVDAIVAKAAAVIGEENVVVEYEIDPTTPFDPAESTPLYVEDVVLFPFDSSEIDPRFYPLLDLGVLLLSQNPQATINVVTRTDARGSEAVNLEVATERAEAVIEYWVGKGVDRNQVIADPRGEEEATEGADEEQAARERRAEFIITGLLQ
jgi:outer membrane protein OmpA-like peptidoglycan-associated protein